jgi:hypothetical protein
MKKMKKKFATHLETSATTARILRAVQRGSSSGTRRRLKKARSSKKAGKEQ